jgi:hypothetical protein
MTMTKEQLMDLQRTVERLQGRVQDMQWELRAVQRPTTERWWISLLSKQGNPFMSSCCSRRVRPNTKTVPHAAATNQR